MAERWTKAMWLGKREAFMAGLSMGREYLRFGLIFPSDWPAIEKTMREHGWVLRRPRITKRRKREFP